MVGGRALIKSIEIGNSAPMEVLVLEITNSKAWVKVTIYPPQGPHMAVWLKADDYELLEHLPINTPLGHAFEAWQVLEKLRQGDAPSITVHQPNEDGDGHNNELIEVNAEWTKWEDVAYRGESLLVCFQRALADRHVREKQIKS